MATATVKVIPPVPQEPVSEYTLVLSEKEAKALYTVLEAVGGSPTNSGRKHAQSIYSALHRIGLRNENLDSSDSFQEGAMRLYWRDGVGL